MVDDYTDERIEEFREECKSNGYVEVTEKVRGETVTYFVVPQERNPSLPDFAVMRSNEHNAVYGISDSVPEKFRKYAVYHEQIEATRFRGDGTDACIRSLKQELEAVPGDLRAAYQAFRLRFFRNLVSFQEFHGIDDERIDGTRKSRDYLEALVGDG